MEINEHGQPVAEDLFPLGGFADTRDAAKFFRCSASFIRNLYAEGWLPGLRLGTDGPLRYAWKDLRQIQPQICQLSKEFKK